MDNHPKIYIVEERKSEELFKFVYTQINPQTGLRMFVALETPGSGTISLHMTDSTCWPCYRGHQVGERSAQWQAGHSTRPGAGGTPQGIRGDGRKIYSQQSPTQ